MCPYRSAFAFFHPTSFKIARSNRKVLYFPQHARQEKKKGGGAAPYFSSHRATIIVSFKDRKLVVSVNHICELLESPTEHISI